MWKESVYSFKGNRSRTFFSEVRKNKEEVLNNIQGQEPE